MKLSGAAGLIVLSALTCLFASQATADYDVTVEIENVSGEKKTDWPVIMTVYRLLGRNLPKGSLNPKGYHVYDPSGKEVEYAVDEIPPYEVPGNDELIFIVPSMEAGAKLVYRVTNTTKDSGKKVSLDILDNPNNLLANAGFEKGDDKSVEGYSGQARLDRQVKHSGGASMLLAGNIAMSAKYVKPITLHPDSWYYFGIWSRTDNVSRGSYATGSKGGIVTVTGFSGRDPEIRIQSQCGNRDWNKSRWFARHELGRTDWGMDQQCVQATDANCTVKMDLDQKKLFIMDKAESKWWLDDAMFFEQPRVTVRFDQALAPRVKDGCFLFYRPPSGPFGDMKGNDKRGLKPWSAMPYAHEAIDHLDRFGLKGQRVPFFFGLYHERPLGDLTIQVEGGTLAGPEGAKLAPEWIEYSHGYKEPVQHCNLIDADGPITLGEPKGIAFFNVTFGIPRDARAGVYKGKIRLLAGEKALADLPVSLAVQDLEMPIVRDHYFGYIFQGGYSEEAVRLYARSGFTSVTIFDAFLKYKKNEQGQQEVDLADLETRMKMLAGLGIAGVNPFSDFDLGPMWNGGSLFRKSGGKPNDTATKKNFQREVLRIEEACKQHPEWPRMIYMTWDEPAPSGGWVGGSNGKEHGGPNEIMGWVNEVAPQALTTLDCMFQLLPVLDKYYTMPCLDDPVDYACPELFDYYRKRHKDFGMASAGGPGEASRQIGIKMITSGARYCHTWHVWSGMMDRVDKKPYRSVYMVAAGQGMDDYRVWRLLTDSIKEAQASGNAAAKAKAKEAETYIAQVSACMNGDMVDGSGGPPYLGRAYTWGYEQFYDDWQEQMARYAAAVKGVKWVE